METPESDDHDGTDPTTDDQRPDDTTPTRRWLIRALVALGLGVPIAIEGMTFLGLIRNRLLGGDDGEDGGDGGGVTPTRTRTPVETIPPGGVEVGDELLPGTVPSDTLREAVVKTSGEGRTFSVTVAITNTGEAPYEVTLGSVWTEDDERIPGSNPSSGQVEPGTSGAVSGTWALPPDATPAAIQVIAVTIPRSTETPSTVVKRVPLGPVPVRTVEGAYR